ncbi:hypothetical protein R5R35_009823 [Gryllus longicercus]|uniref:Uncharacterized protein n=1 Tax=Gryllus longicercus TaxID=2509291 RepID=A0AAN9Z919_9ORTH
MHGSGTGALYRQRKQQQALRVTAGARRPWRGSTPPRPAPPPATRSHLPFRGALPRSHQPHPTGDGRLAFATKSKALTVSFPPNH